jgi:hypothetical protein
LLQRRVVGGEARDEPFQSGHLSVDKPLLEEYLIGLISRFQAGRNQIIIAAEW